MYARKRLRSCSFDVTDVEFENRSEHFFDKNPSCINIFVCALLTYVSAAANFNSFKHTFVK